MRQYKGTLIYPQVHYVWGSVSAVTQATMPSFRTINSRELEAVATAHIERSA